MAVHAAEVRRNPNRTTKVTAHREASDSSRERRRATAGRYVLDDPADSDNSDVSVVYENMLLAIGKSGAKVERGWPPGADTASHLNTFYYLVLALVTADMPAAAREQLKSRFQRNPNDTVTALEAAAAFEPHARWLHESARRLAYRALWQKYFETHDAFLLPPTFTAAFPHDHSEPPENRVIESSQGKRPYLPSLSFWISFAGLAGLPATVAPVGLTKAGLPVGIQIIAPMSEDSTSIEFASLLSEVVGGFVAPPAFAKV